MGEGTGDLLTEIAAAIRANCCHITGKILVGMVSESSGCCTAVILKVMRF